VKQSVVDENSVLARWLHSRYGRKPVRDIVQEIADGLLATARVSSPPVDPAVFFPGRHIRDYRRFARHGGDTSASKRRVQIDDDAYSGRLRVTDDGFVVEAKAGPLNRIRFTLAHEIGHTLFYDLDSRPPQRVIYGEAPRDEEQFCNWFASELLMPRALVRNHLETCQAAEPALSPTGAIVRLADIFRVSPRAMGRRLVEDLGLLDGVGLGCRWLPGATRSSTSEPDWSWRLSWWAVSPHVAEPLYLPSVDKRPKVRLAPVEQCFLRGTDLLVQVQPHSVRLGNLGKVLREACKDAETVNLWSHAVLREGVQLESNVAEGPDDLTPDVLMRQSSEIILFFPIATSAPPP